MQRLISSIDSDTHAISSADRDERAVVAWLWGVAALVFGMIVVGGATRLTQSGLSITEWQPIVGVIPPLTDAAWGDAFAKYKLIPQYEQLNKGMSLDAFKVIFWWEWAHRLLGRITGAVFLLPFVWFVARGQLRGATAVKLGAILLLLGGQGFMGWFMVKSGLAGRTEVSQYRLAAHLTLAFIILAATVHMALAIRAHARRGIDRRIHLATLTSGQRRVAKAIVGLLLVQGFLGALVAGMRAGLAHNTWPLMDGRLIPNGLGAMSPWYKNVFENAMTVQFNHRLMAYLLFGIVLVHAVRIAGRADVPAARASAWALLAAVTAQAGLGIWTLLAAVPIGLGLIHQGGAALVLAIAVAHAHTTRTA